MLPGATRRPCPGLAFGTLTFDAYDWPASRLWPLLGAAPEWQVGIAHFAVKIGCTSFARLGGVGFASHSSVRRSVSRLPPEDAETTSRTRPGLIPLLETLSGTGMPGAVHPVPDGASVPSALASACAV